MGTHLFFVFWLQKPFRHLPPAGPSASWCRQKSELCTAYSLCASLPLPNPAFCSGNVNPALLFGTPEGCISLWSGLSGLTVAVESRMHSRLEIIWLQCCFSCIYNFTLQSLSPSSLIKPATLQEGRINLLILQLIKQTERLRYLLKWSGVQSRTPGPIPFLVSLFFPAWKRPSKCSALNSKQLKKVNWEELLSRKRAIN